MSSKKKQTSQCAHAMAALKTLKDMLDGGLISQAEYDAKKAEIIGRL